VRAPGVVVLDEPGDLPSCVIEAVEAVKPDALLLQGAEEALDDAVLLRRVRRNELLLEPIVAARRPKAAALEDQAVVGANRRRGSSWPQRPEALDAGVLDGPLGLLGTATQGDLEADDLAVVAVDDGGQVGPAVDAAGDVREIHRPALVAHSRPRAATLDARPGRDLPLVDEPSLVLEDPVDRLAVDYDAVLETQHGRDHPVAVRRVLVDDETDELDQGFIERSLPAIVRTRARVPAAHPEHAAHATFRHGRQHLSHSSDV